MVAQSSAYGALADAGAAADFEPADVPFRWLARDQSATYLETGEHSADQEA